MAIWQVGTFGEVSNIKECNAKDRTKLFCAVVYCTYCTNCEVFLGSRTNIILIMSGNLERLVRIRETGIRRTGGAPELGRVVQPHILSW